MEELKAGDVVKILSSGQIGAILKCIHNSDTISYEVLVNGEKLLIDCTQLGKENTNSECFENREEFDAMLTALAIINPGNDLFSLNSGKISFIPYQYRPVLKIIKSDSPRILIADDVGVGKTIEAGLIIKELSARQSMNNVFIFCPRPLVAEGKWQNEMKTKFNERFQHLDRKSLQNAIKECDYEGEWTEEYGHSIIPFSILDEDLLVGHEDIGKKTLGLFDLNPPPKFDLVIVDEAHHIRNQNTQAYKVIQYFCEHAEAVVFLTATPIQLGDRDLYVLLNLLRPDYVIDEETFKTMSGPNPFLNAAINSIRSAGDEWKDEAIQLLGEAKNAEWSLRSGLSSDISTIIENLQDSLDSVELRVKTISDIERLHTFSNIINRTRKRDIGDFTVRKPVTIRSMFSEKQKQLYDSLIEVQTKILLMNYKESMIKFLMSTLYRQASSCIFGLAPQIEDILSRHMVFEDDFETEDDYSFVLNEDIRSEIQKTLQLASQIDNSDEKYIALKKIVDEKSSYDNNKVILFSAFRHTLSYLNKKLSEDGYRVGLVTGSVKDEERKILRNRFMKDRDDETAIDIMLFSEVGCEGLDYQFCDCLINYDLPWNPMRIEQRIGRIDRNGQKSESVLIYNMITEGTVDADIYDRCLYRIGVFNQSLGCSEEILGEITKEIQNIAVDYTLSPGEKRDKLRQLAENKVRLIKENQIMEENQYDFLSIRMPFDEDKKNIQDFTNHWLKPEMICNILEVYLYNRFGKSIKKMDSEDCYEIIFNRDEKISLLNEYYSLRDELPIFDKSWVNYLKGEKNSFEFSISNDNSKEQDNITLVNAIHPLIQMASRKMMKTNKNEIVLKYQMQAHAGEKVGFAIYEWRYVGDRNRSQLKIITDKTEYEEIIEEMVREGKVESRNLPGRQEDYFEKHRQLWLMERERFRTKQIDIYTKRQTSLRLSFEKRLDSIKNQIDNNTNANIIRMKKKEYENVSADYEYRIQQLENQKQKVDVISKFICSGLVMVVE